jgi:dihydroflavonol-4-reductase
MRVFVTGATGLLGSNLVRTLLDAGHEVVALARSPEKAMRELGDTRARIVTGDLARVAGFAQALAGIDVVFHTAAFFREYYTPGDHSRIVEHINVEATLELARAADALGVKKMVHTSSAGIVGVNADGTPGDEATPPWAGVEGNLYLRSKRQVERQLQEFSRESGLFIASAMPAWMWGPHDTGPTASGQLVIDALRGKLPPAIPPGGSSVVDARDVAAGMLRIAEVGRAGERYILSNRYVDLDEIIRKLAAATDTAAPTARLPYAGALVLAAFAQTWSWLTQTPSTMSIESIRLMNARLAVTAARAERELGVRFRPFEQTLADAVAWTRNRRPESKVRSIATKQKVQRVVT